MKKTMTRLIIGIAVLAVIAATGCTSERESKPQSETQPEKIENIGYAPDEFKDRQSEIAKVIKSTIAERDYSSAKKTGMEINYNAGTDDGSFIALVYFDFDISNTRKTANGMMRMYSDDLVATLAKKGITDVNEAVIFWRDDYNNRDVKYAYEYRNGGFFITEIMGE